MHLDKLFKAEDQHYDTLVIISAKFVVTWFDCHIVSEKTGMRVSRIK